MVWMVFIALVIGYIAATMRFVPIEHRRIYKQHRGRMFWVANLLPHCIWITAAVQQIVSPGAPMPMIIRAFAVFMFVAGAVLLISARRVNLLFVAHLIYVPPQLRVRDWPYSTQTHPGYNGMILMVTGATFLLGQWWAFFPQWAYILLILRRAIVENRILSIGSMKPKTRQKIKLRITSVKRGEPRIDASDV